MIPANAGNLKIGKGMVVLADWADVNTPPTDDGYDGTPVGNCESVVYDPGDIQQLAKYSSTQSTSPLLDKRVTRQNPSLLLQCDEHTYANLARYFLGSLSSTIQNAVGNTPITFQDVHEGGVYNLGLFHTTIVSVIADGTEALAVDVDYRHYGERGRIEFIKGGYVREGMDVTVTYTAAARTIERIAGAANLNKFARAVFYSDDVNQDGITAKGVVTAYKAQIAPEGQYGFVSDQYGQYSLRLSLLQDSDHPTELFKVEYTSAVP
jgi:hypothetical protein